MGKKLHGIPKVAYASACIPAVLVQVGPGSFYQCHLARGESEARGPGPQGDVLRP